MNTVGKILVVLNFLFALVVGGFLALDFAARTNWKTELTQYKTELEVSRANNSGMSKTLEAVQTQLQATKTDNETKRLEIALGQAKLNEMETELLTKFKDAEDRSKKAELNFEKALVAQERMRKEVENLKDTIEDRETRILALHKKLKDTSDLALSLDRDLKFSQERNQIMLSRVQELERRNAELLAPSKSDTANALPKDPTQPNPPSKFMRGVVERVDATDKTLVRVSLGTDHGLKVNQTLEVYRKDPTPEYIGLLRIEDAHHHTSVGRLIRAPGTGPRAVREGDIVSSSLNPR